jgi:glycosyltransferase involved in cell wall biosynthesis
VSRIPDDRWGPVALVVDTAEFAGAELYLVTLVEQLSERVRLVAMVGDASADETRTRLADAGAEIRPVEGLSRRPSPRAVRLLTRALRRLEPAVVHANLAYQGDGFGALGARLLSRYPMVATLHLVVPGRARWREWGSRRVLRRFDRVIAVSKAVESYLGRQGVPATLVLNGLAATPPAPDPRAALGLDGADLVVGGVGRLHEQKGWDVLCDAAPIVRKELPAAVFAVVGDGPAREELAALGETSKVRFVGYRSGAAALIPAFDVLALPSRYEGLGLAAVEALHHGVPVVATNIEGLGEVLGDCAVLVPPDDAAALAAGIVRLASDPELRAELTARGRERAERLFSARRMADETFAVYRAAVADQAGSTATVAAR